MSFLSKIIGAKAEKAASEFVKGLMNGSQSGQEQSQPQQYAAPVQNTAPAAPSPSGFSWGAEMPDEENQFNFPGSYIEYFTKVFNEEFPDYDISRTEGTQVTFTFTKTGSTRLIVELLKQSSGAYKTRRDCAKNGIPYLRYYIDHDGWWNTRAYVSQRTRNALGG